MDSSQDYKLIVDPHLRKGHPKVVRYGGEIYKPEAYAQGQVIVHDPRSRGKFRGRPCVDLRVPRYKVDENSTNDLPPLELTLSNLNDNVTEPFIKDMCEKYGKRTLERVKIYYHPETSKHMGLAKLIFSSIRAATSCAIDLHQTSIMGNIVSAVIDSKGEVLKHLYDKIVNGAADMETLPDVIRHSQEAFPRRNEPPPKHDEARRRSSGDNVHHHQRQQHQQRHDQRHDQRHNPSHDHQQRHHHQQQQPQHHHQPPPPSVQDRHVKPPQKHNHHLVTDYDARHPPKEKPPPNKYVVERQEEPHTPEMMEAMQPEENEDNFYHKKKVISFHHHLSSFHQPPPQHQIRPPPASSVAGPPHHLHHRGHPQTMLRPSVPSSVVPPPPHLAHKTTPPPIALVAAVAKSTSSNVASSFEGADSDYLEDDDDEVIVSSSKKSKKSKKKSKKNKHNKKKEARSKQQVLPKDLEDKIEGLLESHTRSNNLESINNNHDPHTPPEGGGGAPSHKRVENFAPRRFTPDDLEDGECSGDEDEAPSPSYGGASPTDSPPIVTTPPEPPADSRSPSAPPLYPIDIKTVGTVSSSSSRSPAVHVPMYQPAPFQRRPLSPSSRRGEPVRPALVPPPSSSAVPARFRGPTPDALRFESRRPLPGSPTLTHLRPRSPPMSARHYHSAPRVSLRRSPGSGGADFDHRRPTFHRPPSPPPPGFMHHPPPPHPSYNRRRSPVRFAPPPSHANRYELRHDGLRYQAPPVGVDDPHSSDRFREFRGSRLPPPGGIVLPPPGLESKRDSERFPPNPYPKDEDRKDHHLERPYSPGDAPVDGKRLEGIHATASPLPPLPVKQQVSKAETSNANNNEDEEEEEDEDKPQLTLDERLREMISSPEASPPEPEADVSAANSEAHSSSGSVDMEISSGESDQPPGSATASSLRTNDNDGGGKQHMGGENYQQPPPPGGYPQPTPVTGGVPAVGAIRPTGPTIAASSAAAAAAGGPHWQQQQNQQNNIWRQPHFNNQRFMMPGQRLPWGMRGEHPGQQFNHRLAPPPPRRHNNHPPNSAGSFPPRGPPGPFPPHPRHPSFRPTDGTRMFRPGDGNQEAAAAGAANWNNPPWLPQQPALLRQHMQQPFAAGSPAGSGSFITGFNGPRIGPAPHQLPNGKQPEPVVETIDPKTVLINLTSDSLAQELKGIIKRDMMKKMIETVAYKQFESWCEAKSYKSQEQQQQQQQQPSTNKIKITTTDEDTTTTTTEIKEEAAATIPIDNKEEVKQADTKLRGLMSTFDPLNWAKGHFEMDGFRIGLGLKTALSKMPSFRVKKEPPKKEEDKGDKDYRSLRRVVHKHHRQDDDDRSGRRKNVDEKHHHVKRKLPLDSDGGSDYSDDDESDVEDDDVTRRAENNKQRIPLHVDDVFSASDDSLLSSDEDIDVTDTDSDVSDDEVVEEKPSEDVTNDKKRKFADRDESSAAEESAPSSKRAKLSDDSAEQNDKSKGEKAVVVADVDLRRPRPTTDLVVTKKADYDSTSPFVSPESLKNIPPKKRFRYYSQDEPSNLDLIADVVCERIRPDSESSSKGPDIGSPTPIFKQENATSTKPGGDDDPLFSDDDAVRMLMLIRSGPSGAKQPPVTEVKAEVSEPKPAIDDKFVIKRRKEPLVTKERRNAVLDIVYIHSYFAIAEQPDDVDDLIRDGISVVERLFSEHSYSYHPGYNPELRLKEKENEKPDVTSSLLPSPMSAPMSAAERVKLKRRMREGGNKSGSRKRREAEAMALMSPDHHLLSPPPAKKRYPVRDVMVEKDILFSFNKFGMDLEDMTFVRTEYQKLLSTSLHEWVNNTHWTMHPVTHIPPPTDLTPEKSRKRGRKRNKKKEEMQEPHKTGCARSEGYYKLNAKTKQLQRRLMCRQADNTVTESLGLAGTHDAQSCPNPQPSASTLQTIEKSREARHMMRRIASEFGAETSDLIKYNQLMFRRKCVKFKRSQIHGWGLFAQETIAADEMVIEYVGELVRSLVADKRELGYTKRGIGSSYLFRIDQEHIIDATKCGNYARFMNHSCNPSCYAKVITVDSNKKIVIYSKDIIKAGEEITYDYKFPIEDEKIPCYCGAPNCRGTLN